ncbi:hypothetical protein FQN54_003068 [Arachnomyces sp. PD_36]|nr:hypothetical protein FQN54_003068 [Arachnomyces sp. PD_36]
MSDHDPPGPAKSSSPSTRPDTLSPNYAYLVHSRETLTQNIPPRMENKLPGRQKRRRTSPEDHAILEAEYQRNPKPDRTARANIVSRVALGDKEVQIWFQNRRQNDRRKSKPLQPHELMGPRNTTQAPNFNIFKEPGFSGGSDMPHGMPQTPSGNTPATGSLHNPHLGSSFESIAIPRSQDECCAMPSSQTSIGSKYSNDTEVIGGSSQTPLPENCNLSSELDSRRSSIKRKRDLEDQQSRQDAGTKTDFIPPPLRISLSFDGEAMVRTGEEKTPSPPKDRKSALRISMSSDGEALIRASNEASPSPSRDRVTMMNNKRNRFGNLQRSASAISLSEMASPSAELRGAKSKPFGRSRDSRTWELHCDTDARSALSASSSHGHAASLSRSSSNRSLKRKSFSGNRNTLTSRPDLANATLTPDDSQGKRKLSRTVSSVARLQSEPDLSTDAALLKDGKIPKSGKPTDYDDIDFQLGDSDKENWLPGTQTSNARRRGPRGNRRRPALQSSRSAGGVSDGNQFSSNKRMKNSRDRRFGVDKENREAASEVDEEVSAFMAGGSTGASQEEDLDCIQGLLSLSQGAWR